MERTGVGAASAKSATHSQDVALMIRYLCRLFAKELVYKNFPGYSPEQLLERMIELSLYAEEHLR